MILDNRPYTFDRVVRLLLTVGFFWGLISALNYLSDALIPFAVALLLAYMINPLVLMIQKKIPNRLAAVFVSLLIVLLVSSALALIIIPMIINEVSHMGGILSKLVNDAALAKRASELLPEDIWKTIKDLAAHPDIQDFFKTGNFLTVIETVGRKVLPGMWGFITGTASFLLGLIGLSVIFLYLIFLLMDYQKVSQGWKEYLPHQYRDTVIGFIEDFETAMSQYFRGQAVVAFICGILFAVGFTLIGLPLGILLGMFIGLLNMVPYLQIIGFIPAFLLAIVHAVEVNTGIWMALGLTTTVFIVVQLIQDAFLVPKIMGKVTGLNPAMIMLSLSVWGKMLGLLGLIIALPMTYLVMVYYRRFLASVHVDGGASADVSG